MPPRLKRSWGQRGVLALNLTLILLALGAAALLNYGYGRAASINRVSLGRSLTPIPEELEPGERVMNVLLVGSDSSANLDEDDPIQIGRQGERFGDVIIIAHIDERTSDIALLSLPRDLWVDVAGASRPSRINRAFEIGGPATLIETIETEFDIPIHHYVNVDFAGFQGLVSAVGSVEIFFDTPARDWNVNARPTPRSQTGFLVETAGCHSLDSEMALAYVRSRYYQTQDEDGRWSTDPSSDLGRIRRQQDFLRRLLQKAISLGARNPFVLRDLIDAGLENVAIDQRLTPQLLVDLGATYRSFDPSGLQTYSFPAVDGQVGQNQVLLPLRNEAEPVLALFAGAGFDHPSTVGLTVRVGPDDDAETASAVARLRLAGFDVDPSARADLPPGTTVRHGPDGRHAAELVVEALGRPATYEQVDGLIGRSVVLLLGEEADDPVPPSAIDGGAGDGSNGNETATIDAPDPGGPTVDTSPVEMAPIPDEEVGPVDEQLESGPVGCG
ncbi:MAG: LCP family protein [Actinomycetota bacterium]